MQKRTISPIFSFPKYSTQSWEGFEELSDKFKRNGLDTIKNKYSWSIIIEKFNNLFQTNINSH